MLATLMTAALLTPAAPIPKDAVPTGPAPYILNLRAAPDGEVKLTVVRTEKQKVMIAQVMAAPGGGQVVQQVEKEVPVTRMVSVGLADLKDVKAYSADGKEMAIKDAVKKANDGGLFVASANGQKVDSSYLKLFKDDVLVFVSPDLIPQSGFGHGGFGGATMMPGFMPGGGPNMMPVPAVMPVAPPLPGGVQIQIAAPAIEIAPPLPPVKKEEK